MSCKQWMNHVIVWIYLQNRQIFNWNCFQFCNNLCLQFFRDQFFHILLPLLAVLFQHRSPPKYIVYYRWTKCKWMKSKIRILSKISFFSDRLCNVFLLSLLIWEKDLSNYLNYIETYMIMGSGTWLGNNIIYIKRMRTK